MFRLRHLRGLYVRNLQIHPILRTKKFDQIFFALSSATNEDSPLGYFFISEYLSLHSNPSWEDLLFSHLSLALQRRRNVVISVFACKSNTSENVLLLEIFLHLGQLHPLGDSIPDNLPCLAVDNENLVIFRIGENYYLPLNKVAPSAPSLKFFTDASSNLSVYATSPAAISQTSSTPSITCNKVSYDISILKLLVENSVTLHNCRQKIAQHRMKAEELKASSSEIRNASSSSWSTHMPRLQYLREKCDSMRRRLARKRATCETINAPDEAHLQESVTLLEEQSKDLQHRLKILKSRVVELQSMYAARRRVLVNQLLQIFPLYEPSLKSSLLAQHLPLPVYTSPQQERAPPPFELVTSTGAVSTYTQLPLGYHASICGVPWYDLLHMSTAQLDRTTLLHVNTATAYLCHLLLLVSQVLDLPLRHPLSPPQPPVSKVSTTGNVTPVTGIGSGGSGAVLVWTVRDLLGVPTLTSDGTQDLPCVINAPGGDFICKEYSLSFRPNTDDRSLHQAIIPFNVNIWVLLRFFSLQTSRLGLSVTNLFHLFNRRFQPLQPQQSVPVSPAPPAPHVSDSSASSRTPMNGQMTEKKDTNSSPNKSSLHTHTSPTPNSIQNETA